MERGTGIIASFSTGNREHGEGTGIIASFSTGNREHGEGNRDHC